MSLSFQSTGGIITNTTSISPLSSSWREDQGIDIHLVSAPSSSLSMSRETNAYTHIMSTINNETTNYGSHKSAIKTCCLLKAPCLHPALLADDRAILRVLCWSLTVTQTDYGHLKFPNNLAGLSLNGFFMFISSLDLELE